MISTRKLFIVSLLLLSFLITALSEEIPEERILYEESCLEKFQYYRAILEGNRENYKAYLGLGKAQEGLFRNREADMTYQKALKMLKDKASRESLTSDENELKSNLKQLRKDLKKYLSSLKKVENIEEEYLSLLLKLSGDYLEKGWREAAGDALMEALLLRPDFKEAGNFLFDKRLIEVEESLLLREGEWKALPTSERFLSWKLYGKSSWRGGSGFLRGNVKNSIAYIIQDEVFEGNYSFFVRVHLRNFKGNSPELVKGGIIFGYERSPESYYLIELWNNTLRLILYKGSSRSDGNWIILKEKELDTSIYEEKWFDFHLVVLSKKSVHFALDGKHIFSIAMRLPDKGKIGFRAENCVATFNQPRVRSHLRFPRRSILWNRPSEEKVVSLRKKRSWPACRVPFPTAFGAACSSRFKEDECKKDAENHRSKGITAFNKNFFDDALKCFKKALILYWRDYQDSPTVHLYLAQIAEYEGRKRDAHARLLRLLKDEAIPSRVFREASDLLKKVDPFPKELATRRSLKKKVMQKFLLLGKEVLKRGHFVRARQCAEKLSALGADDKAVKDFCRKAMKSWFGGILKRDFLPWKPLFSGNSLDGWKSDNKGWKLIKGEARIKTPGSAFLTWEEDLSGDFALSARIRLESPPMDFGAGIVLGFQDLHKFFLVKWDSLYMMLFSFEKEKWNLLLQTPLEKGLKAGKDTRLSVLVLGSRKRIFFLKDGEEVARWRGIDFPVEGKVGVFVYSGTLCLKEFSIKRKP